jgi:uncharacterized protein YcfJ
LAGKAQENRNTMRTSLLIAALVGVFAAPAAVADRDDHGAVPPWMVRQQDEYVYRPQYRPAPVAGTVRCNSATVGSVLGGIVGGVLGNQIGKGDGRYCGR